MGIFCTRSVVVLFLQAETCTKIMLWSIFRFEVNVPVRVLGTVKLFITIHRNLDLLMIFCNCDTFSIRIFSKITLLFIE